MSWPTNYYSVVNIGGQQTQNKCVNFSAGRIADNSTQIKNYLLQVFGAGIRDLFPATLMVGFV